MITNFHNSFRQQRCLPRNGSECELSRHFEGGLRQVLRRMEHLSTLDCSEGRFAFCGKKDLAKFSGYTVRYINGCLEYLVVLGLIKYACQTENGITRRGYVLVEHSKVARTVKKTCVFVGLGKHENGQENFPMTSQPLPNDFPKTSQRLPDDFPNNGSETSQLPSQVTSQNKSATSLEHSGIEADEGKNVQSFAERFVWEGNESNPLIPVNPLNPMNPPTPKKEKNGEGGFSSNSKPNTTGKKKPYTPSEKAKLLELLGMGGFSHPNLTAKEYVRLVRKTFTEHLEERECGTHILTVKAAESLFVGRDPEFVELALMTYLNKRNWEGLIRPQKILLDEFPDAYDDFLEELAEEEKKQVELAEAKRQIKQQTIQTRKEFEKSVAERSQVVAVSPSPVLKADPTDERVMRKVWAARSLNESNERIAYLTGLTVEQVVEILDAKEYSDASEDIPERSATFKNVSA